MANGKDSVKRERLKEPDKTKYELYDILKKAVGRCGVTGTCLLLNLKRLGVEVHFKHKGQTDEMQGVIFTKNGYHFNGSKVDRRFSYSKIDVALQRNRRDEYMELASRAKGNGLGQTNTPTPSVTGHGELFSGSLGLLNGNSSYNTADAEANQEMAEILRRKKKRKRGMRLQVVYPILLSTKFIHPILHFIPSVLASRRSLLVLQFKALYFCIIIHSK